MEKKHIPNLLRAYYNTTLEMPFMTSEEEIFNNYLAEYLSL
jgi:hypothetical protein